MPDYKRKKVKKSLIHKNIRNNTNNDIVMKNSSKNIVPENDIKIVRGTKYNRKKRICFLLSATTIICLALLILSLVLPVGLYENVVNLTSVAGPGKYPSDISGSTVIHTVSNGSHYFVLTDTSILAFSNTGKSVLNEMHGFSNPVLCVSDTRALVYDQGGNTLYIYNLGGKIHSLITENEIITASISRSGFFAVATHSDSYTSVVNVYNKNFKQIFTWNSAKEIINNVLINSTGKRLAVSTLTATSGQYSSKMLLLDFESADPLYTLDLGNSVALSLINTEKGISVITSDRYRFVNWSKFTTNEVTSSGEINMIKNSKNGLLIVFNRANNRSDNTIVLISNKGEKIKEFHISNIITDIQYANGRIYYLSDTSIKILDNDGNVLRSSNCNYGSKKIVVIASNTVATVADTKIEKFDIEKEEN